MNIDKLLTSPEGKTLEFKRDTSALKQIMRTIIEIGMRLRLIIPIAEQYTVKTSRAGAEAQVEAQVDKDILAACSGYALSSSEIASALGHKTLSGNLRKALSRLREAELLEMTIPEKPKSRLQKYRLTSTGGAYLEAQAK